MNTLLPFVFDPAIHQVLSNVSVALDLAQSGVSVFPCQAEGEKAKCPVPGLFWRNQSTTDPRRIEQWWERWPDAIPAIDLAKSDLLVIDCDGEVGLADWAEVSAGRSDNAPSVRSPRGGEHVYFKRNGRKLGNSTGSLPGKRIGPSGDMEGLDVRGAGGYVIAPCATMLDGRRYEPSDISIHHADEIPDWLLEILEGHRQAEATAVPMAPGKPVSDERKRAYGERALSEEMAALAAKGPGERNEAANKIAFRIGQLVGGGCLTEAEAYSHLHNAAASWGISANDKALGPRGTIARAIRDGARSPRFVPDDFSEVDADTYARAIITTKEGTFDATTGEEIKPIVAEPAEDYPDEALQVGGLVGEIADWIMSTAMYPCRLFAVSAALAAVGTVVGRQVYTGVPRAGSALYWLIIAPTAGGKDRPQEALKQALQAADLGHLIKGSVSSSAKLGMTLIEQPVQCQVIDEVGKVLRKFVSRNASSQEMSLLDDYCSIWGKNLGSFEPEGVTVRTDSTIRQPSLTFFGATTPTAFYTQLRSAQVAGGFLNRFLVMQRHKRVPENANVQPEDGVPEVIVEGLRRLHTWQDCVAGRVSDQVKDALLPPDPCVIPTSREADVLLLEARAKARTWIVASDDNPMLEVYARSAEMVKRMALILACGRHWQDMTRCRIEVCDVAYANGLVNWSMGSFVEGLSQHMAENEHQANAKMVLSMIRKAGTMPRFKLVRQIDGRLDARTLDSVLNNLVEGGSVEKLTEASGEKGGRPRTDYVYRGG
ncbi:bifunctional DNA primase/polymerase [Methylobacterium sp. WL19]|uniref:bifunctional DNA primase/polymerase n=1 Tax=Methylobacterium sp. WL19 TaxID=2603896 RepID=UPI0011C84AB8|nr:bifunctional DNA primase/polymerase [Methylobacterium sp. WL19]TXN33918.1 DUF3987 domain-containing protein [Methylobacterium sp. WL19]